jgi:CTP:molybdopterin cytidylyltransferase MocA
VVLAAGYSSRMGRFKPLLPIGPAPAIERAIDVFLAAGIADVTVVTGHRARDLRPILRHLGVREVFNPKFDQGMYSSLLAGIRALPPEAEACFLLPADMPLVSPETVWALAAEFAEAPAPVIYPVFAGQRGHPPLIHRNVLLKPPDIAPADGLRGILAKQAGAREVEVFDVGILLDMDAPSDFEAVCAVAAGREAVSC